MAAINQSWHRWIYASVNKHLHTTSDAGSLQMKVDFADGETAAWKAATTNAQATISGPFSKDRGGRHDIFVDVFVTVTSDRQTNDFNHIDACGVIANALDQCIVCKDYGATGLLTIGTLQTINEDADRVDVTHLRPLKTDDQIFTTIQARFEGTFEE